MSDIYTTGKRWSQNYWLKYLTHKLPLLNNIYLPENSATQAKKGQILIYTRNNCTWSKSKTSLDIPLIYTRVAELSLDW